MPTMLTVRFICSQNTQNINGVPVNVEATVRDTGTGVQHAGYNVQGVIAGSVTADKLVESTTHDVTRVASDILEETTTTTSILNGVSAKIDDGKLKVRAAGLGVTVNPNLRDLSDVVHITGGSGLLGGIHLL